MAKKPAAGCRPTASLDPRVALVEIVHALASDGDESSAVGFNASSYGKAARAAFADRERHPAVALYRDMSKGGLDRIMAFKLAQRGLSANLTFSGKPGFWSPTGDPQRPQLAALLEALASFANEGGFARFFDSQKGFVGAVESGFAADIAKTDYPGILSRYARLPVDADYAIFVCPLLRGPTSSVDKESGRWRVDTFWPPATVRDGEPDFGYARRGPVVWHELSHVLLDDLSETHAARIAEIAPKRPLDPGLYGGSWPRWIRESVSQGLANRLLAWSLEQGLVEDGNPIGTRGLFLDEIEASLKEFEAEPRRYPTLRDFYPRLLDAVEQVNR